MARAPVRGAAVLRIDQTKQFHHGASVVATPAVRHGSHRARSCVAACCGAEDTVRYPTPVATLAVQHHAGATAASPIQRSASAAQVSASGNQASQNVLYRPASFATMQVLPARRVPPPRDLPPAPEVAPARTSSVVSIIRHPPATPPLHRQNVLAVFPRPNTPAQAVIISPDDFDQGSAGELRTSSAGERGAAAAQQGGRRKLASCSPCSAFASTAALSSLASEPLSGGESWEDVPSPTALRAESSDVFGAQQGDERRAGLLASKMEDYESCIAELRASRAPLDALRAKCQSLGVRLEVLSADALELACQGSEDAMDVFHRTSRCLDEVPELLKESERQVAKPSLAEDRNKCRGRGCSPSGFSRERGCSTGPAKFLSSIIQWPVRHRSPEASCPTQSL